MKNEALEKLIDYLKCEIEKLKEYDNSFDSKSWGYEEGILITGNEALTIIKACEGRPDSDTSGGLHLADVNTRALRLAESLNRQLYNRPSSIDADGYLDIEADSKLVVGIMQKFFIEHVC